MLWGVSVESWQKGLTGLHGQIANHQAALVLRIPRRMDLSKTGSIAALLLQ